MAITFKRVARDCPANDRARAESKPLIYDFNVLIDGDHRAEFRRETTGRGYRLYDADHRALPDTTYARHLGALCDAQALFLNFIETRLARIPTLGELADLRAKEAAQAVADDIAARQAIRNRIATQHGPELLAMLKRLAPLVDNGRSVGDDSLVLQLRDLIKRAEDTGPYFEDNIASEVWSIRRNRG